MRPDDRAGCTLLRRLMHQGAAVYRRNTPQVQKMFADTLGVLPFVHAIYDPTQRVEPGDDMSRWFNLRLPFDVMYVEGIAPGMIVGSYLSRLPVPSRVAHPSTKFTVGVLSFCQTHGYPHPMAAGAMMIDTDENGDAIDVRPNKTFDNGVDNPGDPRSMAFQIMCAYPAVQTVSLMNDAKIATVELNHDRAIQKRVRQLDQADARTRYSVLVLKDELARIGGKVDPVNPGLMPLHVVRGHWSEYGINGKGRLFGHLSGRFWFQEHEKGNAKNGRIERDYQIAAGHARSTGRLRVGSESFAAAIDPTNRDIQVPQRQEARP